MIKHIFCILFLFTSLLLTAQSELKVLDFESLSEYLQKSKSKVTVVNFWATWCKPCVNELPHFEELQEKYDEEDLKVFLVSLDFKNQIESKLEPFIRKNELKSEVVVLYDMKMNEWIDKVDPDWSGSIPATLLISGDKKSFFEQEFASIEELEEVVTLIKKTK